MKTEFDKYEKIGFSGTLSPCFEHVRFYLNNKMVLDIASGDGVYLKQFGVKSVGLDISEPNLLYCKNQSLKVIKSNLNLTFPIKDKSFDRVFCSNILEHVDSPIFMLRECHRVLKDNGILVLCVPNENSIIHWYYDYYEENGRHLYAFSKKNLYALMRESNFEIIKFIGDYHSHLSHKLKLSSILELLHYLPFICTNRLSHFYWLIVKKKVNVE